MESWGSPIDFNAYDPVANVVHLATGEHFARLETNCGKSFEGMKVFWKAEDEPDFCKECFGDNPLARVAELLGVG